MRLWLIICGFLLISSLVFVSYERQRYSLVSHEELLAIRKKLKGLSPQERQDLTYFFGKAISFDPYPYTLVGYKPMSITHAIVEDTDDLVARFGKFLNTPGNQTLKRGYLVWEKYQSLFPRSKYILISYSFFGEGRKELALINPKLCLETIEKHLGDFQEVLGETYTKEEVFWILTHPHHKDFYTIIDHNRLVGILLGFGRNNAYLYEQYRGSKSRSAVSDSLRLEEDPLEGFNNEWPWPGRLFSPCFVCDPTTKETQRLKKHYKKARTIVHWTYFLRNKLEVTLALLMQS